MPGVADETGSEDEAGGKDSARARPVELPPCGLGTLA